MQEKLKKESGGAGGGMTAETIPEAEPQPAAPSAPIPNPFSLLAQFKKEAATKAEEQEADICEKASAAKKESETHPMEEIRPKEEKLRNSQPKNINIEQSEEEFPDGVIDDSKSIDLSKISNEFT